jgi:type IV secretory pathway component VirB8
VGNGIKFRSHCSHRGIYDSASISIVRGARTRLAMRQATLAMAAKTISVTAIIVAMPALDACAIGASLTPTHTGHASATALS